jgi:ankyrin repeat protein
VIDGRTRELAPIHEAAQRGDVEAIREELKKGVPVDLREGGARRGPTPLMWAALRGQTAAVEFLIQSGAAVDADVLGFTPLMAAAYAIGTKRGDPATCLDVLVAAGANLDAKDDWRRRAIHYACGADPRPLKRASHAKWWGDPPEALVPLPPLPPPRHLLRYRQSGEEEGTDEPSRAERARHGDARRLQALISAGARLDIDRNPLSVAVFNADAQRVQALLKAGVGLSAGEKPDRGTCELAAKYGTAEMFRLILEASGPADGIMKFAASSIEDGDQKVRLLVACGANPNEVFDEGGTPLLASLDDPESRRETRQSDAATILLEAGADPRIRDPNGNTMLILAAKNGSVEILRRLLALGFDPNESARGWGYERRTPLMLAAGSRRDAAEKVRLLLTAGAQVDRQDRRGHTALLAAAAAGNQDAVVLLVEAGARVNLVGDEGMTPLHLVAQCGESSYEMNAQPGGEAARALIRHGAKIDARNRRGQTPRELAMEFHHTEVIEALDAMPQ